MILVRRVNEEIKKMKLILWLIAVAKVFGVDELELTIKAFSWKLLYVEKTFNL